MNLKSQAAPPAKALTPLRRKQLAAAARDLQGLHDDWKAAVGQHQMRIEGQFKELSRRLKPRADAEPTALPSPKQTQRISAVIDAVRLKPKKGRAKDLRDVERLLQVALKGLPEAD